MYSHSSFIKQIKLEIENTFETMALLSIVGQFQFLFAFFSGQIILSGSVSYFRMAAEVSWLRG